jgi:cell division protein FtsB
MNKLKAVFRFLSNKYVYTSLAFLVWITVFDRNNLIRQYKLTQELKMLQKEQHYYLEEIRKDSIAMVELLGSIEKLEKFGRERYLMKKDDEDIFLILREDKDQ